MAIEIATAIDGQISEDDKESWLSVEEFRNRHEDILSMSYEQANEMSLEEIPFMDDVRDPIWEEDDRRMRNTSKPMEKLSWMTRRMKLYLKGDYTKKYLMVI